MNKSKRIYIDTSVISAIFDQRTPERMSLTKKMWENIDAIATVNDIGYLLSWNFKHLVKVKTRKLVSLVNTKYDYSSIEIIVPPEL